MRHAKGNDFIFDLHQQLAERLMIGKTVFELNVGEGPIAAQFDFERGNVFFIAGEE